MRTLVVEQSAMMRRIVRYHLDAIGFNEVVEAPDIEAALEKLDAERIELVITAWSLGEKCAAGLTRVIRSTEDWSLLPVIAIVGGGQAGDAVAAVEAGAHVCVGQPVTADALRSAIEEVLDRLVVGA